MKRQVNARFSAATRAKLDVLTVRYGTQAEAIAVAIDRLYSADFREIGDLPINRALAYAREAIENGRIDAETAEERAEQIEIEVAFSAAEDAHSTEAAAELGRLAREWYLR